MSYLLDADWAIEALIGNLRVTRELDRLRASTISISWLTVAEIYEGAFDSSNPEARINAFRYFPQRFRHLGVDEAVMLQFAELRAHLRRTGNIIADFDLIIAATALVHDLTVLTFNLRHFQRVPGLRVYPPV